MTEEQPRKLCPFNNFLPCQEEKCMAWVVMPCQCYEDDIGPQCDDPYGCEDAGMCLALYHFCALIYPNLLPQKDGRLPV